MRRGILLGRQLQACSNARSGLEPAEVLFSPLVQGPRPSTAGKASQASEAREWQLCDHQQGRGRSSEQAETNARAVVLHPQLPLPDDLARVDQPQSQRGEDQNDAVEHAVEGRSVAVSYQHAAQNGVSELFRPIEISH